MCFIPDAEATVLPTGGPREVRKHADDYIPLKFQHGLNQHAEEVPPHPEGLLQALVCIPSGMRKAQFPTNCPQFPTFHTSPDLFASLRFSRYTFRIQPGLTCDTKCPYKKGGILWVGTQSFLCHRHDNIFGAHPCWLLLEDAFIRWKMQAWGIFEKGL